MSIDGRRFLPIPCRNNSDGQNMNQHKQACRCCQSTVNSSPHPALSTAEFCSQKTKQKTTPGCLSTEHPRFISGTYSMKKSSHKQNSSIDGMPFQYHPDPIMFLPKSGIFQWGKHTQQKKQNSKENKQFIPYHGIPPILFS